MKWFKRLLFLVLLLIVCLVLAGAYIINPFGPSPLNTYQKDGELALPGLTKPVTVVRDASGMAYITAQNLDDLYMAQGFVAAQDRLFQMELTRLFASGRIGELAGVRAKALDIRNRTLGFRRNAERHVKVLNDEALRFLQKYVDGVNAFIETRPEEIHLEFKLAGIKPGKWEPADSLTILNFMGWGSAANLNDEVAAQMLVEKLGPEKAAELFPININPDFEDQPGQTTVIDPVASAFPGLGADSAIMALLGDKPLQVGSNNWVTGPDKSAGGKPIVCNDPHLDARTLPGPWYPSGLIAPGLRAVGVTIPGMPGMAVGRTEHVAYGVTNAYGDTQDLYVETVDPDNPANYLEGDRSIPFEVIEETFRFKDKNAPNGFSEEKVRIRRTRRGPVVSGVLEGLETNRVITMRWSAFETQKPSIGFERLIKAKSVDGFRRALEDVNQICLNFVFADKDGSIGWQVSGEVPVRTQGESLIPFVVKDGADNWTGFIPFDEMPHAVNPDRGWISTCNHKTVAPDYPYYYSTHFSPSFRQRRISELLNEPGKKTVDDHWSHQRDTLNLMAKNITPIMVEKLSAHEDTKALADALRSWDFHDTPEKSAPLVFQSVYRHFAMLVFGDELGDSLAGEMLENYYFWQERLQKMVLEGRSPWFDDVTTKDKIETSGDLFHRAGLMCLEELGPEMGTDPAKWQWGKVHVHDFISPIRRSGPGKDQLGGGAHPAPGSGETLYRGIYSYNKPYAAVITASLRMVADLSDPDKILAVLPGGVSGRQFDPLMTDQVAPFMNGEKRYWWFSDKAIEEHAVYRQELQPK